MLTLGQAAKLTGAGKTTLTRAIKAGRLSATRNDDGSYAIDPAELHRVYTIRPETLETSSASTAAGPVVRDTTGSRDAETDPATVARLAALEEQVKGMREMIDELKRSRDTWQSQADKWQLQAERAILMPPPETSKASPPEPKRSWWQRLAG